MKFLYLLGSLLLCLCSFISSSQSFDIYVCDAGNFNNPPWQILKFDQNGQNPSVFINTQLGWPQDIVFLEDSNLVLISNLNTNNITKYNATTGAYLGVFASGIGQPTRMKIGADSSLYVLQWAGNGKVKRYGLDGTFLGDFTSVGVNRSIGMDWDLLGNLYVSSYNGDFVRKFDTSGNDLGLFINSNLAGPTNIWFDSNGDLLVSDYDGFAVKRFDSSGAYQGIFMSGLQNSEGVAFLPNGNILIGNGGTSSVKQYSSSGTYINDFIAPATLGLINPNAITIRSSSTVGIEKTSFRKEIFINPTIGDEFEVNFLEEKVISHISIYNATGKLIRQIKQKDNIDLRSEKNGIIFIQVHFFNGEIYSQKLIVRH